MSRLFQVGAVLAVALALAGCAEPAPESESKPAPEAPAAKPPAEKPAEETPAEKPAEETPAPEPPSTANPAAAQSSGKAAGGESPSDDTGSSGPKAPEIQAAYWLNTDPLSLADLRGKIVVLEFWATWCPPCRTTIPHLVKMYNKYKGKGVTFVSLTNEPRQKVEPFAEKMGMVYPIGGGSPTGRTYGVRGIPHAFIIDPSGHVVWQGHPMGGLQEALETQYRRRP